MTDRRESWFGFMFGTGACGDWRYVANRSMAVPASGGFIYELVTCRAMRGGECTYIGSIDIKRLNVRARKVCNMILVFAGTADDKDDEASALHVQRQGLCQGQRWGTSNDHNLCSATVSGTLSPSRLTERLRLLVALEYHNTTCRNHDSGQDLISRDPSLHSLHRGQDDHWDLGLGGKGRSNVIGEPCSISQCFAHNSCGAVHVDIDVSGYFVCIFLQMLRDVPKLHDASGKKDTRQQRCSKSMQIQGNSYQV